jgi:hypothetical protein
VPTCDAAARGAGCIGFSSDSSVAGNVDTAGCSFIRCERRVLAEAGGKGRLVIRYSDLTSAFYRTIIEIFNDEDTLDDLRKAGWTIEPARAGVYQHPEDDEPGIRIESDGGRVDWNRWASPAGAVVSRAWRRSPAWRGSQLCGQRRYPGRLESLHHARWRDLSFVGAL